VPGGVYSALRGSSGIVSKATFVPVAGTGVASGAGLAGAGALTVAAPLVLMAVAVGASAVADQQRQKSIDRITDLLEKLHDDKLERDRDRLDGCRDAIDKATSVLLDQGRIGQSLGLDSASHEISTAISTVRSRLGRWREALDALPDGPVELSALKDAFPGITEDGGAFGAHLETARLAIALKRRVLVLQAVEHAQLDGGGNPFRSFLGELRGDEQRLTELESGIDDVLTRLSSLELKRPRGVFRNLHFTPSEVDELLTAAYRLKDLGAATGAADGRSDVLIEIEQARDGSVVVFPAEAIEA